MARSTEKLTFSYRNYFAPTPKNLQYLMGSLKAILAAVTGTSVYNKADEAVVITLIVSGVVLDQFGNFFGHIVDDQNHMTLDIPMNKTDRDDPTTENVVTITHESQPTPPEQ